ncbi:MAG: bifunctional riboflavin kinase/FAD synthetase [Endomicrobiaceae bacterium]|nr:bifunctional riboflavin kinase/FAD synthetase [Endomicrobiaceae bacterium]
MKQSVITIGTFDGIHKGHQVILNKVVEISKKDNLKSIVLSFENPVKQVSGLITTTKEKLDVLSSFGIDEILLLPVNKKILSITADKFFEEILVKKLNVSCIVVGYDCTFGKNRQGNIKWLKQKVKNTNIKLVVVNPVKVKNKIVSSSEIRNFIIKNKIKDTNIMLNRIFSFTGKHVTGNKIGRTLGFPTINIKVDQTKLLPKGVFTCIVSDKKNNLFCGVLNIGIRPTVDLKNHNLSVEIHLLDFSNTWKEKYPTVYIYDFVRKEQKFKNIELLKKSIQKDVETARKQFKNLKV